MKEKRRKEKTRALDESETEVLGVNLNDFTGPIERKSWSMEEEEMEEEMLETNTVRDMMKKE